MAGPPLAVRLARLIETEGPVPVSVFMQMALGEPEAGYYAARESIGAQGDFITAPEVSQMFGEIIGAFLLQSWNDLGAPAEWSLVELGPGRGTLMSDILRVLRLRPEAMAGLSLHLVETSARLRAAQSRLLTERTRRPIHWHARIEEVPEGPMLCIANEFFDALPIRQLVRHEGRWQERCVVLASSPEADPPRFDFALCPLADDPGLTAPEGTVYEICAPARAFAREIGHRLSRAPGRALIIDYGYGEPGTGDTLQAVKAHKPCPVLSHVGEADITAHVDFTAIARAARRAGAAAYGPVTQGDLLERLGIGARAQSLRSSAPGQSEALDAALRRLVSPEQMGTLFKAMCLSSPHAPVPPGFDLDRRHDD